MKLVCLYEQVTVLIKLVCLTAGLPRSAKHSLFPVYLEDDILPLDGYGSVTDIHVQTTELSTGLLDMHDVKKLRDMLFMFDHENTDSAEVILTIDQLTLRLINSPAYFHPDFHFGDLTQVKIHLNKSKTAYHPCCIFQTAGEDSNKTGIFNLCYGVHGHFILGNQSYLIHTKLKEKSTGLIHYLFTNGSSTYSSKENSKPLTSSLLPVSPDKLFTRQKRDNNEVRYLELFVLVDYDFYNRQCSKDSDKCYDTIFNYIRMIAVALKHNFNLRLVTTGLTLLTDTDNYAIPINKKSSYIKEHLVSWLKNEIKNYAIENIKPYTEYDLLWYVTKSNKDSDTIYKAAVLNSICADNVIVYTDATVGVEDHHMVVLLDNIAETLGGTNKDCGTLKDCPAGKTLKYAVEQTLLEKLQSIFPEDGLVELQFCSCAAKWIKNKLTGEDGSCLRNDPGFTESLQRCGNAVLDPDEVCEWDYTTAQCCKLDCTLRSNAQCGQGVCCNLPYCKYTDKNTVCRESKEDCDFTEICTGEDKDCPTDEDGCGRWGAWSSWSVCDCQDRTKSRLRACDNPPPSSPAFQCEGSSYLIHYCNESSHCTTPTTTTTSTTTTTTTTPTSPTELPTVQIITPSVRKNNEHEGSLNKGSAKQIAMILAGLTLASWLGASGFFLYADAKKKRREKEVSIDIDKNTEPDTSEKIAEVKVKGKRRKKRNILSEGHNKETTGDEPETPNKSHHKKRKSSRKKKNILAEGDNKETTGDEPETPYKSHPKKRKSSRRKKKKDISPIE